MSLISCQLTVSNGPQLVHSTVTEAGPGTYEINYTPPVIRGSHHLRVMVGGVDIPGSTFLVPILQSSPETRGQPLHTLQGLEDPCDVAVSSRGKVVVCLYGAGAISIFNSELLQNTSVGSRGAGAYQFAGPTGIAITNDDCVLVADCFNHRIQVLTIEGHFITSIGTRGKGPLQFEFPLSVLVHPNGQIFRTKQQSYSSPQPRSHILSLVYYTWITKKKVGRSLGHGSG